jgi:hypothetical protein
MYVGKYRIPWKKNKRSGNRDKLVVYHQSTLC